MHLYPKKPFMWTTPVTERWFIRPATVTGIRSTGRWRADMGVTVLDERWMYYAYSSEYMLPSQED